MSHLHQLEEYDADVADPDEEPTITEDQAFRDLLNENLKEWRAQLRFQKVEADARERAKKLFAGGNSKMASIRGWRDPKSNTAVDANKTAENQAKMELANIYYDIEVLEARIAAAEAALKELDDA